MDQKYCVWLALENNIRIKFGRKSRIVNFVCLSCILRKSYQYSDTVWSVSMEKRWLTSTFQAKRSEDYTWTNWKKLRYAICWLENKIALLVQAIGKSQCWVVSFWMSTWPWKSFSQNGNFLSFSLSKTETFNSVERCLTAILIHSAPFNNCEMNICSPLHTWILLTIQKIIPQL